MHMQTLRAQVDVARQGSSVLSEVLLHDMAKGVSEESSRMISQPGQDREAPRK